MCHRALLLAAFGFGTCVWPESVHAETASASVAAPSTASSSGASAPTLDLGRHSGAQPWGTSNVGVSWINDNETIQAPLVESSGFLRASRWHVGFVLGHAPESLHTHVRIENGFRLWGALAQRAVSKWGASHLTLAMGFDNVRYAATTTATTSLEMRLTSRLDLRLLTPELVSFFVDGDLGYVGRRAAQHVGAASDDIRHLQYLVGLGAYLGDPTTNGTELRARYFRDFRSYCERQVTFPALTAPSGCVGFDVSHFTSPTWGLRLQTDAGKHGWVVGLYVVGRAWSESAESNGLFSFGQ